jgi:hypothetical protein
MKTTLFSPLALLSAGLLCALSATAALAEIEPPDPGRFGNIGPIVPEMPAPGCRGVCCERFPDYITGVTRGTALSRCPDEPVRRFPRR